jgi:hypothetical protein
MLFFNISFFSPRSSGTYSLEIRIVTSGGDGPPSSVIGNATKSFSDQSAAISNSVTTQFPTFSPPVIATPETLNANAVTSGKTKPRNTSFRAFN